MKKLLKLLFLANKAFFMELMVEDLYGEIPLKVSDPGITILREQITKMDRWFRYQSLALSRRMVNNPKEAGVIMGMLLQVKVMMWMLSGGQVTDELAPDTSSAEKAAQDRVARETKAAQDLANSIEIAKNLGKKKA